jgi:hypothetical protein
MVNCIRPTLDQRHPGEQLIPAGPGPELDDLQTWLHDVAGIFAAELDRVLAQGPEEALRELRDANSCFIRFTLPIAELCELLQVLLNAPASPPDPEALERARTLNARKDDYERRALGRGNPFTDFAGMDFVTAVQGFLQRCAIAVDDLPAVQVAALDPNTSLTPELRATFQKYPEGVMSTIHSHKGKSKDLQGQASAIRQQVNDQRTKNQGIKDELSRESREIEKERQKIAEWKGRSATALDRKVQRIEETQRREREDLDRAFRNPDGGD